MSTPDNFWRDQLRMIANLKRPVRRLRAAGVNMGSKQRRRQVDVKRRVRS